MKLERESILSRSQKLFLVTKFLETHKNIEIQDLYKWLYYGEFGYEERSAFLKAEKGVPKLQQILDEIDTEKELEDPIQIVWEPLGCSHRFIMVYITPYYSFDCPLLRIVNLMERSPAFRGSRMQFKLDWGTVKEHMLSVSSDWSKEDFYQFEDRIGFHQLPIVDFSEGYLQEHPYKYRVLSQKLFFEYFPEFYDEDLLLPVKRSSPSIG